LHKVIIIKDHHLLYPYCHVSAKLFSLKHTDSNKTKRKQTSILAYCRLALLHTCSNQSNQTNSCKTKATQLLSGYHNQNFISITSENKMLRTSIFDPQCRRNELMHVLI